MVALAGLTSAAAAFAQDPLASCASCHALSRPTTADLDRLLTRKGPDLYYAGLKFKRDWLVRWLQNPTVLRPGGIMYSQNVQAGAPGTPDTIDTTRIPAHPKLSASEANAAADALMSLGGFSDLVQKGAFKQEPSNAMMAALLFNKLRGCASCHSAKEGSGGLSGPELYTAGDRLQPDYIVEYIRDPQKFDPHIWMPRLELNDRDVQNLASFLTTLKKGDGQ